MPNSAGGGLQADALQRPARRRVITSASVPSTTQGTVQSGDNPVSLSPRSVPVAPLSKMVATCGLQRNAEALVSLSLSPVHHGTGTMPSGPCDAAFAAQISTMSNAELRREFPNEFRSYQTQLGKDRPNKSTVVHDAFKGAEGFRNFLLAVERWPGPGYSIDRFPERHGPYAPGNIRWASFTEQTRNRDCTAMVEAFGRRAPVAEWAKRAGVLYEAMKKRIHRAEEARTPIDDAILGWKLPPKQQAGDGPRRDMVEAFGRSATVREWANHCRVAYGTLKKRLQRARKAGTSNEEAILNWKLPPTLATVTTDVLTATVTTQNPYYVVNDWITGIPTPVLAAWKERYAAFIACAKKWPDGEGEVLTAAQRDKLGKTYLTKAVFTVAQLDHALRAQLALLHCEGIDLHDPDLPDELLEQHPEIRRFNIMHGLRHRALERLTPEQRSFARGNLFTSPGTVDFVRKMGWKAPPVDLCEPRPMWMRVPAWWARTDAEREELAGARAAWIAARPAREAARAALEVRTALLAAGDDAEAKARREFEVRREAEYARVRAASDEHARSPAADVSSVCSGWPPRRPTTAEVIDFAAARRHRSAA